MLKSLLATLSEGLQRRGFAHMLVGGQAVLQYARFRVTEDIDITVAVPLGEWQALHEVALELGLTPRVSDYEEIASTAMLLLCQTDDGMPIDFIMADSPYERQAMARARLVETSEGSMRVIAPEDLIIFKLIADRPQDIEDVRSVMRRQSDALDLVYLREWLGGLGEALGLSLLDRFEQYWRETRGR